MMRYVLLLMLIAGTAGCQTAAPIKSSDESYDDVEQALGSVAGALRGKELTPEEREELKHQIRTDKDAQDAIRTIGESMSGQTRIIRYCPVTGKRYASTLEVCPIHDVPLEILTP